MSSPGAPFANSASANAGSAVYASGLLNISRHPQGRDDLLYQIAFRYVNRGTSFERSRGKVQNRVVGKQDDDANSGEGIPEPPEKRDPIVTFGWLQGPRQQLNDLLTDTTEVGSELDEHLSGNALALTNEAEQNVLGADVVVTELESLAKTQLEHLLCVGSERNVTRRG